MKNKLLVILPTIFIVIAAVACAIIFSLQRAPFRLDEQYYNHAALDAISAGDLQQLVDEKKSFAVFVSQPSCRASADFEKVLREFVAATNIQIYEIAFSDLKDLSFASEVRFYPSFLISKQGKLVDFLEADNDDDAAAYTSLDGFKTWFTEQVIL